MKVFVLFDCKCCDEPTFAECELKAHAKDLMNDHDEPILLHMIHGHYIEKI